MKLPFQFGHLNQSIKILIKIILFVLFLTPIMIFDTKDIFGTSNENTKNDNIAIINKDLIGSFQSICFLGDTLEFTSFNFSPEFNNTLTKRAYALFEKIDLEYLDETDLDLFELLLVCSAGLQNQYPHEVKRLIEIHKDNGIEFILPLKRFLAYANIQLQFYNEAKALYDEINTDSNLGNYLKSESKRMLSICYINSKRYSQAETDLNEAISLSINKWKKDYSAAQNNLAFLYYTQKKIKTASKLIRKDHSGAKTGNNILSIVTTYNYYLLEAEFGKDSSDVYDAIKFLKNELQNTNNEFIKATLADNLVRGFINYRNFVNNYQAIDSLLLLGLKFSDIAYTIHNKYSSEFSIASDNFLKAKLLLHTSNFPAPLKDIDSLLETSSIFASNNLYLGLQTNCDSLLLFTSSIKYTQRELKLLTATLKINDTAYNYAQIRFDRIKKYYKDIQPKSLKAYLTTAIKYELNSNINTYTSLDSGKKIGLNLSSMLPD